MPLPPSTRARLLAAGLDAPLVFQRCSRLVVDANRRPEAATSMAPVADETEVPGNRDLAPAARVATTDTLAQELRSRRH